jgi:hypothetical protein
MPIRIKEPLPPEEITGAPELKGWTSVPEQEYFIYEKDVVRAKYEELMGLTAGTTLSTFLVVKSHYKSRMADILRHVNYFINYYDPEGELFVAILSLKYIIDQKPKMKLTAFKNLVVERIMTDSIVEKIKKMTHNLYNFELNADDSERFNNTPKITNIQAKMINAFSFTIRLLLPICIHYSNISPDYNSKTGYIKVFDNVYCAALTRLEEDDVEVFSSLYSFIEYRVDRSVTSDSGIWNQKKQLHGIVPELYLDDLVHQVIIVKNLHKLDYTMSCVSFFDAIIRLYNKNFKQENYRSKPYEIDVIGDDSSNDDYLSHAESLEMQAYKIDESNIIINDANVELGMLAIRRAFNIPITEGEFEFYMENMELSTISAFLLHVFYAKRFGNSNMIYILPRRETVELLIILKKYLLLKGFVILPHICTAIVQSRYRLNMIKQTKLMERLQTSNIWNEIIKTKFKYVMELEKKKTEKDKDESVIVKRLSQLVNSVYTLVDTDDEIHGMEYGDVDAETLTDEFILFLSII